MNYVLLPLRHKDKIVYSCVDMEDICRVSKYTWSYVNGYARTEFNARKSISLHRFVLGLDANDKVEVDHINRDKLDNRKANLRLATRGDNNINAIRLGKNKYRGVYQRSKNSFRVSIMGGNPPRKIALGGFRTAEEAARAYNKLALIYHGKFAVLNEIPEFENAK